MGENAEVPDMNIAKAKDLINDIKYEYDSKGDGMTQINIRHYDGIWDNGLSRNDVIEKYAEKYAEINHLSSDNSIEFGKLFDDSAVGCFSDFKCEGKSLKDIIVEDFKEALKTEFPQNFN